MNGFAIAARVILTAIAAFTLLPYSYAFLEACNPSLQLLCLPSLRRAVELVMNEVQVEASPEHTWVCVTVYLLPFSLSLLDILHFRCIPVFHFLPPLLSPLPPPREWHTLGVLESVHLLLVVSAVVTSS
jgi:hypothetical protein